MVRLREDSVVERTVEGAAALEADERRALGEAGIDPEAVSARECSYRMLLDAGLEAEVADVLRRRFSLPWSFDADGDLGRRSTEVRGLGEAERAWIEASADETWQAFEPVRSGPTADEPTGTEERPYPRPTPTSAIAGVGPDDADALADAGINSAERLATVDARAVATALDLDVVHVRTWRYNAREFLA